MIHHLEETYLKTKLSPYNLLPMAPSYKICLSFVVLAIALPVAGGHLRLPLNISNPPSVPSKTGRSASDAAIYVTSATAALTTITTTSTVCRTRVQSVPASTAYVYTTESCHFPAPPSSAAPGPLTNATASTTPTAPRPVTQSTSVADPRAPPNNTLATPSPPLAHNTTVTIFTVPPPPPPSSSSLRKRTSAPSTTSPPPRVVSLEIHKSTRRPPPMLDSALDAERHVSYSASPAGITHPPSSPSPLNTLTSPRHTMSNPSPTTLTLTLTETSIVTRNCTTLTRDNALRTLTAVKNMPSAQAKECERRGGGVVVHSVAAPAG